MLYREFVKANYDKVRHLPPKQRMTAIAQLWRASKSGSGGAVAGGRVRARKTTSKSHGSGFLSGMLDSIGLGVPTHKRVRRAKAGAVAGGNFLTDAVETASNIGHLLGLGLPEHVLHKHYQAMQRLEAKSHTGKLTPAEHTKLKVYHHLHGAGFFDKLWSGVKNVASGAYNGIKSGVSSVVNNLPLIKKVVPEIAKVIPSGITDMVKDKAMALLPGAVQQVLPVMGKVVESFV